MSWSPVQDRHEGFLQSYDGEKAMNLMDYRKGDEGTLVRIAGSGDFRIRIMEMGLIKGTKVLVVKYAPLGDPWSSW